MTETKTPHHGDNLTETDNIQRALEAIVTYCGAAHYAAVDIAADAEDAAPPDSRRVTQVLRCTREAEALAQAAGGVMRGEPAYDGLAHDMQTLLDAESVIDLSDQLIHWAALAEVWPSPKGEETRHAKHVRLASEQARAVADRIRLRGHATAKDIQEAARAGLMLPLSPSVYASLNEVHTEAQTVAHGADELIDGTGRKERDDD